jgi:hypothetical protein
MTIRPKKVNRKDGKTYYSLVDEKRVNGKVVQKYVGYLGKDPKAKTEVKPGGDRPDTEEDWNRI